MRREATHQQLDDGRDIPRRPRPARPPRRSRGEVVCGRLRSGRHPKSAPSDPGEPWEEVTKQIYGPPPTNMQLPSDKQMRGFWLNYASQWGVGSTDDILATSTPQDLPVINTLARAFAVSDMWIRADRHQSEPCVQPRRQLAPEPDQERQLQRDPVLRPRNDLHQVQRRGPVGEVLRRPLLDSDERPVLHGVHVPERPDFREPRRLDR